MRVKKSFHTNFTSLSLRRAALRWTSPFISKENAAKLQNSALIFYIGFAAFKLNKKLKCSTCANFMIEQNNILKKEAIWIKLRAYKTIKSISEVGNLTVPSSNFESLVKIIHVYFEEEFSKLQFESDLLDKLMKNLLKITLFSDFECEKNDHKLAILKFILIGLIKFSIKKSNKFLSKSKVRKTAKFL